MGSVWCTTTTMRIDGELLFIFNFIEEAIPESVFHDGTALVNINDRKLASAGQQCSLDS